MIDPSADFAGQLADMRRRIDELERHASRPPSTTIEAGQVTSGSTDTNGDFSRTFAAPFSAPPFVVASPTEIIGRDYAVMSVSETGFTVRMFDTSTGAALPSLSARFSWVAVGT